MTEPVAGPSVASALCPHCLGELVAVAMTDAGMLWACPCGLTTWRSGRPAPDYNPKVDHPERYSDGRPI